MKICIIRKICVLKKNPYSKNWREKLKISIFGAIGKMGQEIAIVAHENDIAISHFLDIEKIGKNYNEIIGKSFFSDKKIEDISFTEIQSDVIIDFSFHTSIYELISTAKKYNQKLVIGTTGYTKEEQDVINKASEEIAILQAPNMSIGVNLIFEVLKFLGEKLDKNYEFDLVETHHNQKKDVPSGTCKKMLDILNEIRDTKIEGHSMRLGNIFGEHSVTFVGNDEKVEIKHTALSRGLFAKGAIKAAKFILTQDKGLYSMKEVINGK